MKKCLMYLFIDVQIVLYASEITVITVLKKSVKPVVQFSAVVIMVKNRNKTINIGSIYLSGT